MADLRSLNVEDLTCERGGAVILDGLSFSLASGQALFLRGPNGSGKTTLIRALTGLLPLKRGRVFAIGDDERPISDLQSQLHYIGHANGVKDRLSAIENVRFWQRYYDGE